MIQSDYNAIQEQKIIRIVFYEDCEEERNQLSLPQRNAMLLNILKEIKDKEGNCYV